MIFMIQCRVVVGGRSPLNVMRRDPSLNLNLLLSYAHAHNFSMLCVYRGKCIAMVTDITNLFPSHNETVMKPRRTLIKESFLIKN